MLGPKCKCSKCKGLRRAKHCPGEGRSASGYDRHGFKASTKAVDQPRTCGRTCRPGYSCRSTVRGGVCPCRDC